MSDLTPSEKWVKDRLEERGWKVFRNGWPDFMCMRERDFIFSARPIKYVAVEVKAGNSILSPEQKDMHTVLSKAGLAISVINPDHVLRDFQSLKGKSGNALSLIEQEALLGHMHILMNKLERTKKDVRMLEDEIYSLVLLGSPTKKEEENAPTQ